MQAPLWKYLIESNYSSISKIDFNLQLLSHPEFPSTKSITDTLDYFNIDNIAISFPKDNLEQMPRSFLALIDWKRGEEYAFVTRKKDKCILDFENAPRQIVSINTFMSQWKGVIIVVEKLPGKSKTIVSLAGIQVVLMFLPLLAVQILSLSLIQLLLANLNALLYGHDTRSKLHQQRSKPDPGLSPAGCLADNSTQSPEEIKIQGHLDFFHLQCVWPAKCFLCVHTNDHHRVQQYV